MEDVLAQSHGGRDDEDALLEFRRMCWAALLLMDDSEAQQLNQLVQRAKDLYSEGESRDAESGCTAMRSAARRSCARLHAIEGGYGKRWRDLRAA